MSANVQSCRKSAIVAGAGTGMQTYTSLVKVVIIDVVVVLGVGV